MSWTVILRNVLSFLCNLLTFKWLRRKPRHAAGVVVLSPCVRVSPRAGLKGDDLDRQVETDKPVPLTKPLADSSDMLRRGWKDADSSATADEVYSQVQDIKNGKLADAGNPHTLVIRDYACFEPPKMRSDEARRDTRYSEGAIALLALGDKREINAYDKMEDILLTPQDYVQWAERLIVRADSGNEESAAILADEFDRDVFKIAKALSETKTHAWRDERKEQMAQTLWHSRSECDPLPTKPVFPARKPKHF